MSEMKTLNGYEIVDAKAREDINKILNIAPKIEVKTQAEYDAIETKDETVIYIIKE